MAHDRAFQHAEEAMRAVDDFKRAAAKGDREEAARCEQRVIAAIRTAGWWVFSPQTMTAQEERLGK